MLKIECKPIPGKRGEWLILVDDEEWKRVHKSIFGSKPKIPNDLHSIEALESWFRQAELKGSKKYALERLARKSQPSSELKQALQKVKVSLANIETVIQEFQNLGYLDDKDWIERYITAKLGRKMGPLLVAAKLRAKGFLEEEITSAIKKVESIKNNTKNNDIASLVLKRYSEEELQDFKTRRKVFAALTRKGFHTQAILEFLDRYNQ